LRLFRREPVHRQLAREGGLDVDEPPPHDTTPRWGEPGIHGIARPREWDVTATADAPDIDGTEHAFVVLPDGTLIVEAEGDFLPLAAAVEGSLAPPYRAVAVRRSGDRWAVAARRIDVVELPPEIVGETVELTVRDGERELLVDGARSTVGARALERLGGERFPSFVLRAERLDGDLWDVTLTPL
jgi:hypothetical protein